MYLPLVAGLGIIGMMCSCKKNENSNPSYGIKMRYVGYGFSRYETLPVRGVSSGGILTVAQALGDSTIIVPPFALRYDSMIVVENNRLGISDTIKISKCDYLDSSPKMIDIRFRYKNKSYQITKKNPLVTLTIKK